MADAADPQPPSRGKLIVVTVLVTTLFWTLVWGGYLLVRGQPQQVAFAVQPPPATATPAPTATPLPTATSTATAVVPTSAATASSATRAGVVSLDAPVEDAASPSPAAAPTASTLAAPGTTGLLINVNTASAAELESLPGIGPKTAEAIIAYREEHGPFATIEAITDVKGIGPATLEKMRALITIN